LKKLVILFLSFLSVLNAHSQKTSLYQIGILGEENLKAIANLNPNSTVVFGFDTRYEGIKGSSMLLDTLTDSFLMVRGDEKYIRFKSDVNLVKNSVVFMHPVLGKLMEISSDIVDELIFNKDDKELVFRTTKGINFEKEFREIKFYQVLKPDPNQFIRMPVKTFIEADYKGGYSSDRRYDEYLISNKYYILGSDNIFHQIQLTRKSMAKMFPGSKALIDKSFREKPDLDPEEIVKSILENL
jgi:hypothetical protein